MAHQAGEVGRQALRSNRSTRRLLESAEELIAEVGYGGTTLAAVGQRAGYSRGIVTVKFGSKANLLAAVVARITAGWSHTKWLPAARGKNGLDGFLALISAICHEFERDAKGVKLLYALMFEATQSNEDLQQVFVEFHRSMRADLADILRRGIADGSVRPDIDVRDEVAAVVSGLRGIGYQWILDPEGFSAVAALRNLYERTGVRLRPGAGRASGRL